VKHKSLKTIHIDGDTNMISNIAREEVSHCTQHAGTYAKPFAQNNIAPIQVRNVAIQFPETVFSALRRSPDEFVQEMRLAAAVKWYELQLVSQAKAAEIAGISRYDFLEALSRFNVSPFQVTPEELLEEIARD
jgi:predicted HTH domain antitoxin